MTKEEFKKLYEKFKTTGRISKQDFDNFKGEWDKYFKLITSPEGLPLDSGDYTWLKKEPGDRNYLPGFFETNKNKFGGGRCGDFRQYMIYHDFDKGYFDGYAKRDDYADTQDNLQDHYKTIRALLKNIVETNDVSGLIEIERKDDNYKNFRAKQVLRKLAVLHFALDNNVSDKNCFLWIYDEKVIDNLVELLIYENREEITENSFFEKSNAVWKWAVECCEDLADDKNGVINDKDGYNKFAKLNNLLWELGKNNAGELMNFEVPNVIYHGAPGTGKTYTTLQTVKLLCQGDNSRYKYCQFHPSYSYQDFIEGIKPMGITAGGNVQLEVVNGIFKQFCIYVKKKNEDDYEKYGINYDKYPHYYFIVDEINRGDLSRIFGETFSLLEPDYRDKDFSGNVNNGYTNTENLIVTPLSNVIEQKIKDKNKEQPDNTEKDKVLAYKIIGGKVYFGIPFNIHFIGLMNDVDKSIDTFDLALRRRFKWITKKCDYDVIRDKMSDMGKKGISTETIDSYIDSCDKLNKFITDGLGLGENYKLGQSYFMKITSVVKNKITDSAKKTVFENYIETTLREYAREVCDENEIDDKIKGAKKAFGIDIEKTTNRDEE